MKLKKIKNLLLAIYLYSFHVSSRYRIDETHKKIIIKSYNWNTPIAITFQCVELLLGNFKKNFKNILATCFVKHLSKI